MTKRILRAQNGNRLTCPIDMAIVYVMTDGLSAFQEWLRECDGIAPDLSKTEIITEIITEITRFAPEHQIDVRL